jgi:hypothetical protein
VQLKVLHQSDDYATTIRYDYYFFQGDIMPNYQEWNHAIATHTISIASSGSVIFLNINEQELRRIGTTRFRRHKARDWLEDFCKAIRQEVNKNNFVNIKHLYSVDADNRVPNGVAFLAATVLAAYRMTDENDESGINYFKRLRDILDLQSEKGGRPLGMEGGQEEPLWLAWERWLNQQNFLCGAKRKSSNYISYPISQAILRRIDQTSLYRFFKEKNAFFQTTLFDERSLLSTLKPFRDRVTKHLSELLNSQLTRDEDELGSALLQALEDWREGNTSGDNLTVQRLTAGLYRTEDWLSGEIQYLLHPRQRRGISLENTSVLIDGQLFNLTAERNSWCYPISNLDSSWLEEGFSFQSQGNQYIDALVLPKRECWILVRDPEQPESPDRASWGQPVLGEPFILLAQQKHLSDLERLKIEGYIQWQDNPQEVLAGWLELKNCVSLIQDWSEVIVNQKLVEALKPRVSLGLSLFGGLQVGGSWISEHGPTLTVHSFDHELELKITRLNQEDLKAANTINMVIESNKELNVSDWKEPGVYQIRVLSHGQSIERLISIKAWNELVMAEEIVCESLQIGNYQIQGSNWLEVNHDTSKNSSK